VHCAPIEDVTDVARAIYYITKTLKMLKDASAGVPPP
jgi:hypothetical protein